MISPPLSWPERQRAARIYKQTKWAIYLVLGIVSVAIYASVLFFWEDGFLQRLLWTCLLCFTAWTGEHFAQQRLQKAGLSQARQETRIITRTSPVQAPQVATEDKQGHSLRSILYRGRFIVFPLCAVLLFGLLQFGTIVYESQGATFGYKLVALTAIVVVALFILFLMQKLDKVGPDSDLVLQVTPWERVAKVEEVRIWNFKNTPVECHFKFLSDTGKVLQNIQVPGDKAAKMAAQIEAQLNGE